MVTTEDSVKMKHSTKDIVCTKHRQMKTQTSHI
jgi:hypothetical protein